MSPRQPFTCHDCGDTFQPADDTCATGYAVLADTNGKVCYECARTRDLRDAAYNGKLIAYVESHKNGGFSYINRRAAAHEVIDKVTTWPGLQLNVGPVYTVNTWRSNFGDVRTAFTCNIATGPNNRLELWHGLTYGDNGTYCRLRRAKNQPVEKLPRDGQPVLYDTRGRLTAYGLACGYVERHNTDLPNSTTTTKLWRENNVYHILSQRDTATSYTRLEWYTGDTLTEAYKAYSRHIRQYHKGAT